MAAAFARLTTEVYSIQVSRLRSEAAVYGLTTALAERKSVVLDAGGRQGFSRFLIRGHLIAQGPPAPPPVVRAAMVCLVNGFAKGAAGVRPELAEMMVDALNRGLVPAVRSLGSVGQADLGPMADLAEGLLNDTGFVLGDYEGLALVNNNAFATGWAALAWQTVGNTLFGYAVWNWLLARHPAATVAPVAIR